MMRAKAGATAEAALGLAEVAKEPDPLEAAREVGTRVARAAAAKEASAVASWVAGAAA